MALFDWNDSYSIGVEEIDRQHSRLVRMVNVLADTVATGRVEGAERVFQELTEYTEYHFTAEEVLMERAGFPARDSVEHRHSHHHFVQTLRELRQGYFVEGTVRAEAVMEFMVQWLTQHILGEDQRLGRFLKGNAPQAPLMQLQQEAAVMARQLTQALTESESRFRSVADQAPVLMWLSQVGRGRTFVNRGWLDFTGRRAEQELEQGFLDSIHPEDRHRWVRVSTTALTSRRPYTIEFRLRHADGEHRWVLETGSPRTDGADLVGFIGLGVDITERKRAELLLLGAHDELEKRVKARTFELEQEMTERQAAQAALLAEQDLEEELSRKLSDARAELVGAELQAAVGTVASRLTEGLSAPLASLEAGLESLGEQVSRLQALVRTQARVLNPLTLGEGPNAELREAWARANPDAIAQQAPAALLEARGQLAQLNRQVADIKASSHCAPAQPAEEDLNQAVEAALAMLDPELSGKVQVQKTLGALPRIFCQGWQLRQAVTLVLLHSLRALSSQGRLTVKTSTAAHQLYLEVTDDGPPVSASDLERLFEPFGRIRALQGPGSFGLCSAREIVRQHGGELTVWSEPEGLTTYRLRLPLVGPTHGTA